MLRANSSGADAEHVRAVHAAAASILFFITMFLAPFQAGAFQDAVIIRYNDNAPAMVSGTGAAVFVNSANISGVRFHTASAQRSSSGRYEVIPVTIEKGADRNSLLEQLMKVRGIKRAEFDIPIYSAVSMSADPHVNMQYHMAQVDAERAWDSMGNRGNGNFVAVVMDTGMDINHPDLADALWVNAEEIPGNNVDDDENGLTDDSTGWNFENRTPNIIDDHGHGTHVSGIIAARENGVGVTGIAPETKILPFKIMNRLGMGSMGNAVLALDIIRGYKTRERNPADIRAVNMSFSSRTLAVSFQELIAELGELGIAVFAAAGNDSQDNDLFPSFPANCEADNLVSVGSLQADNTRSAFSNYGQASVNVYAYGGDIYSTYMGGGYATLSGTSMAAPLALGCFLLGWSSDPSMNVYEALTKFHAGLEPTECAPLGRAHARKAVETPLPSCSLYRFREHLAIFSSPAGRTPVTSTVSGVGLDGINFSISGGHVGNGASGAHTQELFVSSSTGTDSPYRDIGGSGGRELKRMLFRLSDEEANIQGLEGTNRYLARDGMTAKIGNTLYFPVSENRREHADSGRSFIASFCMDTGEWNECEIFPPDNYPGGFRISLLRSMFAHGKYVYIVTQLPRSILRYDTEDKNLEWHPLKKSIAELGLSASFVSGGGKVWFVGGDDEELSGAIGEFSPETGDTVVLWRLPDGHMSSALAYRDEKLYVAGGFQDFFHLTQWSYTVDVRTGEYVSSVLPFAAAGGQLLFGKDCVYYVMGERKSSSLSRYGDRYMAARGTLSRSGWITGWKIYPEAIYSRTADSQGTAFFVPPGVWDVQSERLMYLFSGVSPRGWKAGWYPAIAGVLGNDPTPFPPFELQPEPEPEPTPPSGGGGGCSAAGGSPMLLMLLVPALLFARGRK